MGGAAETAHLARLEFHNLWMRPSAHRACTVVAMVASPSLHFLGLKIVRRGKSKVKAWSQSQISRCLLHGHRLLAHRWNALSHVMVPRQRQGVELDVRGTVGAVVRAVGQHEALVYLQTSLSPSAPR